MDLHDNNINDENNTNDVNDTNDDNNNDTVHLAYMICRRILLIETIQTLPPAIAIGYGNIVPNSTKEQHELRMERG